MSNICVCLHDSIKHDDGKCLVNECLCPKFTSAREIYKSFVDEQYKSTKTKQES